MGINYARFFVGTITTNLRTNRGRTFGKALDGTLVSNIRAYKKAVVQIRSPAGATCRALHCNMT